jgi:hypothetical protein
MTITNMFGLLALSPMIAYLTIHFVIDPIADAMNALQGSSYVQQGNR